MALFGRKDPVDRDAFDRQLAQAGTLEGTGYTLRAKSALAGLRQRTLISVVEICAAPVTGWFHVAELQTFLKAKADIVESWNGSPNEMFLARASAPAKGSAAFAAMAGLVPDQVALLQPTEEGMETLLVLDPAALQQMNSWLQELPGP